MLTYFEKEMHEKKLTLQEQSPEEEFECSNQNLFYSKKSIWYSLDIKWKHQEIKGWFEPKRRNKRNIETNA